MRLLGICIFLLSSIALAENKKAGTGIAFDVAFGYPSAKITNPDDTIAYYQGLSLTGRAHLPLLEYDKFEIDLTGSARYMDFKNTINGTSQKELGQHLGPGVGVEIRLARVIVGYEYYYMLARHYSVGTVSKELEFSMPTSNLYGGIEFRFGQLSVEATYSQARGKVPSSKTGFENDSPYGDQTFWLHLKYSTGYSLLQFLSLLF